MAQKSKIAWGIFILILFTHVCFQYYLLLGVANGRYSYHIDNAWRALSSYKWSQFPFVTYNPVRFPLEFAIYGTVLKFWPNIPLALATTNIAFSTGIIFLVFLLTRSLSKSAGAALVASLLAAFISRALQASIGCMSEIIMCFWVLGGIYFYLRFEKSSVSKPGAPLWASLYASAVFFLLGSAQRIAGWDFLACYLILLIILYLKNRAQASELFSCFRNHLLICAAISILFVFFYIIYAYQRSGQLLIFANHYRLAFKKYDQLIPRYLIYPLHLFRLEPLLILLSVLGIFISLKVKRIILKKYLLFFALSFIGYELIAISIGADVYSPARAVFIFAFMLCPLAGLAWEWIRSKNKVLGTILLGVILANLGFNLPKSIRPVHDYAKQEGEIDSVGRYLRRLDPSLSEKDNILVELGDKWPVPTEYYLFYYIPERVAFDRGGAWGPGWKKVLFTRSFKETYLGYPEKMMKGSNDSLFDKPKPELEKLLRDWSVPLVVTFSDEASQKMTEIYQEKKQIGKYRIFADQ